MIDIKNIVDKFLLEMKSDENAFVQMIRPIEALESEYAYSLIPGTVSLVHDKVIEKCTDSELNAYLWCLSCLIGASNTTQIEENTKAQLLGLSVHIQQRKSYVYENYLEILRAYRLK